MKIIFSRKGFDASAGGVPSPILPSERLYSLPIPRTGEPVQYADVALGDGTAGELVRDLTACAVTPSDTAHLDPDLDAKALPRPPGWRPLFGQAGAAQGHLRNQGIGEGDLFLFYGWFRRVERSNGTYRYGADAPDLHVLFGWLQVGRMISVRHEYVPPWAQYHPHWQQRGRPNNVLYVAREQLSLPVNHAPLPGAGVFSHYHPLLRLTAPQQSRSVWRLPAWFHPDNVRTPLSYHGDLNRWQRTKDHVLLRTAPRGQEFVLDCNDYPEAVRWTADILQQNAA